MIAYDGVSKRFPDGTLAVDDLRLEVNPGEFMILVGPSGCGKTTALRMAAGLEDPTEGEIRIAGRVVNDVPPAQRDVAMVFQNYALYPHLTVWDNIGFPLRRKPMDDADKAARIREVAELLSIEPLLGRRPKELSGGQRQRVAMGRAIVRHPQAFLMDEPLSNLDAKLRVQMRAELLALHARLRVTTVYVTHDQIEAMTLGERVAVMRDGMLQQVDTPQRLYRQPANTFVAGFIGSPAMNFLAGSVDGAVLRLGSHEVALPERLRGRAHGPVLVGLRPDALTPAVAGAPGTLPASVRISEELGSETLAYCELAGVDVLAELVERPRGLEGTVLARVDADGGPGPRGRIALRVAPERLHLFAASSGEALSGDRGLTGS